jgi:hypothetical protein
MRLTTSLSIGVLAYSIGLGICLEPAQAQGTKFVCRSVNGVPTTVAETNRGVVPVIRWVSDYFSESGWTPEARCQEVSQRFQTYHEAGSINYLTTGRINRQPVICTSDRQGGTCQDLLFTLKQTSNPSQTLQELMNVRVRASGPLNETSEKIYVDMGNFLETAPVLDLTNSNAPENSDSAPAETLETTSDSESIW